MDDLLHRLMKSAEWHEKQGRFPGPSWEYHHREVSLQREAYDQITRWQAVVKKLSEAFWDSKIRYACEDGDLSDIERVLGIGGDDE